MIFVNLPVKDLKRATAFYNGLGYASNPQFSDDKATNIVISDTIFLMLLVEDYFSTFTNHPVADATKQTEAIVALSADSHEAVDSLAGESAGRRRHRDARPQ